MHFEILVEDRSGKRALDILVPKIIDVQEDTFKVHPYRGIGRIPKDLKATSDASKRILLDQLPRLLKGYGETFANYPEGYLVAVIVVCDLDNKCLKAFRKELYAMLDTCSPRLKARFCVAIEEGEAWFLGDVQAIKYAYPKAKDKTLNNYVNDSICDTWECLADAVYIGGAAALSAKGWQVIGAEKSEWADKITPLMDVDQNKSPSFKYFLQTLRGFLQPGD